MVSDAPVPFDKVVTEIISPLAWPPDPHMKHSFVSSVRGFMQGVDQRGEHVAQMWKHR